MSADNSLIIGIDARLSGKEHAGIGRYIENLIIQLLQTDYSHINWVIFFHHRQQAEPLFQDYPPPENLRLVFAPIRHYSFAEQTHWPKILKEQQLDLLHVPHFNIPLFYRGKLVVTIHDLLWHQQIGPEVTTLPSWKYYAKYLAYRLVTAQALKRAAKILVPTKSVESDLLALDDTLHTKIVVTPEGISQPFQQELATQLNQPSSDFTQRAQSKKLIYVGSLYPHKNIEVVLQALKLLPDYQLQLVCSRDVFVERTQKRIEELELLDQVHFSGYLSDEKLIEAIQSSLALVQPSKSEGFGLTAIEAMAAGTPVLASQLPVFKEIYQEAPLYFDPDQPQELMAQLKKLQQKETFQQKAKAGLEVAQKYDWAKTAQQTLNAYLQLEK